MPANQPTTRKAHEQIKIGDRFGRLIVTSGPVRAKQPCKKNPEKTVEAYVCKCDCGTQCEVVKYNLLKDKNTKSCGCLNLTARKYCRQTAKIGDRCGRWTIIAGPFLRDASSVNRPRAQSSCFLCRCDCGTEREVRASQFVQKKSRSCGCLSREVCAEGARQRNRTHGMSRRKDCPEYHVWTILRGRCSNSKDKGYHRYGGRGITVCGRWNTSFSAFYADMGPRPSARHSIDRIDNNGGYWCGQRDCVDCGPLRREPNCRWATPKEQSSNMRTNVILEHDGKRLTQSEWARITGLNFTTITYRLRIGCSVADALTRHPKYNRKANNECQ